jgi:hypothetical protein
MLRLLFRYGLNIAHALGEKLQPVVTSIIKATIHRIFGRELIEELSDEVDSTVRRVLSFALALLHDVRGMLKGLGMYKHLRLVMLWNDG